MSDENLQIYDLFMPPSRRLHPEPPAAAPPRNGNGNGSKQANPPKNAVPNKIDQTDAYGKLCQFGINLLNSIRNDYNSQVEDWRTKFGQVLAAFSTAVETRNKKLTEAKEERERDAAFDAFVLSLVMGGSMHFLGAHIEHVVVPNIKFERYKYMWNHYDWKTGLPSFTKVPLSPKEFTKTQATAFGGIAQEIGNKSIAYPQPAKKQYQLDSEAGVERLRSDFTVLVNDTTKFVHNHFETAQSWMNQHYDFGEAWMLYTNGNFELARQKIIEHFDKLRNRWANEWEFFGKSPHAIFENRLADQFERTLWAGYLLHIFAEWNNQSYHKRGHRLIDGEVLERVIITRLRELNMIVAEKMSELTDQANRLNLENAPRPTTKIGDELDRLGELRDLEKWCKEFLKNAKPDTERTFFPPASRRTLPALRAESYRLMHLYR